MRTRASIVDYTSAFSLPSNNRYPRPPRVTDDDDDDDDDDALNHWPVKYKERLPQSVICVIAGARATL